VREVRRGVRPSLASGVEQTLDTELAASLTAHTACIHRHGGHMTAEAVADAVTRLAEAAGGLRWPGVGEVTGLRAGTPLPRIDPWAWPGSAGEKNARDSDP
jgi:hypothetical protein